MPDNPTPATPVYIPIPDSPMLTAALTLANTIALIILEGMKGQTPEQKRVLWQWWIDFWGPWYRFWGFK